MVLFKYLTLLLMIFALSGCDECFTNYSSDMKKILVPMQKKLEKFFAENKRYPNIDERNVFLEESGCVISNDMCKFYGDEFLLLTDLKTITNGYILELEKNNTLCSIIIFEGSQPTLQPCEQYPCFPIKQ